MGNSDARGMPIALQTSTSACLFNISPTIQGFPVSGGTGSFAIAMPTGCSWAAVASDPFISITSPATGGGNGVLNYAIAQNTGPSRTGTITVSNGVNTRIFQIQQASGCPQSASQTSVSIGAAGGSRSVAVTAGGGCSWLASTVAPWIHITSTTQTGSGALTFTVDPNPSMSARSGTITAGPLTIIVSQAGSSGVKFDFDGDARADLSIFRPTDGVWWIAPSGAPAAAQQFGLELDRIVPADYDGDRKTDLAVYRDGVWYIFLSQTNLVRYVTFGLAADIPAPGDFDGDGRADVAVYRPSSGVWHILRSIDGNHIATAFGLSTDRPAVGDYDGDGRSDIAIYRAGVPDGAQSTWAILESSSGSAVFRQFGVGGDIPAVGDYDGDARDNIALFRPSTGTWYTSLDPSTNYGAVRLGAAGDIPVAADCNGDGRTDHALYRQGVWYIRDSTSGSVTAYSWGINGDKPIPAAFTQP